jgi:D-arabinose 1-dehydrogenase-like Zn-dependent alcohol dehydrogenase
MARMRAVQVSRAKAPLEVVERDVPEPGPGPVRIRVEACGMCHKVSPVRKQESHVPAE